MKPAVDDPVKKFTTLDTSGAISMFIKKTAPGAQPEPIESSPYSYNLFKIHFNIILSSIHTSSKRSFLSGILSFCALCSLSMLRVSHRENHYTDFFVLLFIISCSNILFSILSSNNQHLFFPESNRPVSYQYTPMEKITVWCFFILSIFIQETEDFELNGKKHSPDLMCCKPLINIMLVYHCYFQIL